MIMLAPCTWRLLTLTTLLCLVLADESPHSDYALAFTSPQLGVRVEQADVPTNRAGKNLLPPYQPFSLVDNIRYVDSSSNSNRNSQVPHAFGSFRFVDESGTSDMSSTTTSFSNHSEVRRSDDEDIRLGLGVAQQQPQQQPYMSVPQENDYIPLPQNHVAMTMAMAPQSAAAVANTQAVELHDKNQNFVLPQQINDDFSSSNNTSQAVEILESIDLSDDDSRSARRVGFRFPDPPVPFVPQSYSEDGSSFDASSIRRPFFDSHLGLGAAGPSNNDPQEGNEHMKLMELFGRSARDLSLSEGQPTRPVYLDQSTAEAQLAVQRGGLRTYPTIYYQNEPRPRHYFPPKIYDTNFNDFGGGVVTKAKFPSTWKSRTPRVIFPVPENSPTGLSSQYTNDNVVFK